MRLAPVLRRVLTRAPIVITIRRRSQSAPYVDQILADIIRRLRTMEPDPATQAVISLIQNDLPAAISAAQQKIDAANAAQAQANNAALTAAVTAEIAKYQQPAN